MLVPAVYLALKLVSRRLRPLGRAVAEGYALRAALAEQNLAIINRVKSSAVRVYYDVGNSTHNGYDVPQEIRLLGDRICQIHFKDNKGYLGEGEVDMKAAGEAMQAIAYTGWVVLETKVIGEREADFKRNAAFTRTLLGLS